MDTVTMNDLERLLVESRGECVSIYMPTHRAGRDTRENPTRFKNLLKSAEKQLAEQTDSSRVSEILRPAFELLEDKVFWLHQGSGLAAFASPDFFRYYRLVLSFSEQTAVEDHFYLKPLVPLLMTNGRFYILALSQHQVNLYEATLDMIQEAQLPEDMPRSIEQLLKFDELQKLIRVPSTDRPGRKETMVLHGHGSEGDPKKHEKDLLRYAQAVDRGLSKVLAKRTEPLVLAGVDHIQAIYRKVSSYRNLMDEGVPGSPAELPIEQLHTRAWQIAGPQFAESLNKSLGRYADLSDTNRVSAKLEQVLPAAHTGRIQTLFVDTGQSR